MTFPHALIIDDNLKNLTVLSRMLNDEGVSNTQIADSKQLDSILANEGKVDVVFLDLEMPDASGYDIFEKLKTDQRFAGVPFVAYTVLTSEINTANDKGFHSFLAKPLDPDKFPAQLSRILRGEAVWDR